MTRWLVVGAGGMLGRDLVGVLGGRDGVSMRALTRKDLDIRDGRAVAEAVTDADVVVNAAAWTDVDGAEAAEAVAYAVNASGPAYLASACARTGARLLHVSTDYVFGGEPGRPWQVGDSPAPRNAYGRTKLAGEEAVRTLLPEAGFVVRSAWLYGAHGPNFLRTIASRAAERDVLEVVDDQHGQPTWTEDLARGLAALGGSAAPAGIYHLTSSGSTTWYGLARAVLEELGADPDRIRPVPSACYPRPAARPAWSVLGHEAWLAAGLAPLPHWRDALRAAAPTVLS